MEPGNVSAVISATAGIAGVLLGNGFTFLKEHWVTRKHREQDAAYLAVLVVAHLDATASACLQAAYDIGEDKNGVPAGGGGSFWAPTTMVELAKLHELDVNWKSLPVALMRDCLSLSVDFEKLRRALHDAWNPNDGLPHNSDYFWERREGYARLGLRVLDTSRALRRHTDLWSEDDLMNDLLIREDLLKVIGVIEREATSVLRAS